MWKVTQAERFYYFTNKSRDRERAIMCHYAVCHVIKISLHLALENKNERSHSRVFKTHTTKLQYPFDILQPRLIINWNRDNETFNYINLIIKFNRIFMIKRMYNVELLCVVGSNPCQCE